MKVKQSSLLVLCFTLTLVVRVNGQSGEISARNLDAYLQSANQAAKFNGVALVAQKGKILLHKTYGWRNYESQSLNDTATRFPILSITKSFSALIIMMLQDQGKLSTVDKVNKYIPDFPHGSQVTIAQLLNHTSGIYDFTNDVGEEDSAITTHPIERKLILDHFYNRPLEFKPGKEYSYSNSGYFLLGMIIEKLTGKPYESVVRELIFEPLGMNNSGFDYLHLPPDNRAWGYTVLTPATQRPYLHFDSTYAWSAGAIYSTSSDMYRWARAIAKGSLISPGSWKSVLRPGLNQYGYGFKISQFFGHTYFRHDGGYPGFSSDFVYYPADDLTIILLNNTGNYGQNVWAVAMGISSIVFGKPYDLWKPRIPVNVDSATLKSYTGTYQMENRRKAEVLLREGQLFIIITGLPEFSLQAFNENSFYFDNFNTELTFHKTDGKETLVIHEHGEDNVLRKVK